MSSWVERLCVYDRWLGLELMNTRMRDQNA